MFTRSELVLLHHVANGMTDVSDLSETMGITPVRVYEIIRSLKCKGILSDIRGIKLSSNAYALRLASLMRPSSNRAEVLADSGIDVLIELREPHDVAEIVADLGLSRASVYRRLKLAMKTGAVRKDGEMYVLNDLMWNGLREALDSIVDQREVFDPRVVSGAVIYRNTRGEALYSYPRELDDRKTAFSMFGDYGYDVWLDTIYYTTSDIEIGIDKAFNDAYIVSEKEDDVRLRMTLILFYLGNRERIAADPTFLEKLGRIQAGERIPRWPTWADVQSRLNDKVVS